MRLLTEEINEFEIKAETELSEGFEKKKNYYIEGIFLQSELVNKNRRRYPFGVMKGAVDKYITEKVSKNRANGELDHPAGPTVNLKNVSHRIISLKEDGNNWIGKALILDTPAGTTVQRLLDGGVNIGCSSRALGSVRQTSSGINEVQNDFWISTAADIVSDPSAPDAFVNGLMEGREWVWDNGVLHERAISELKGQILAAPSKLLEETAIKAFATFLNGMGLRTTK